MEVWADGAGGGGFVGGGDGAEADGDGEEGDGEGDFAAADFAPAPPDEEEDGGGEDAGGGLGEHGAEEEEEGGGVKRPVGFKGAGLLGLGFFVGDSEEAEGEVEGREKEEAAEAVFSFGDPGDGFDVDGVDGEEEGGEPGA